MAAKDKKPVHVIDTPEDAKKLTEHFAEENEEIFKMLGQRLNEYSEAKNFLFINWFAQVVVNLLKDANNKLLDIDKSKMQ